jgi:hypothetical protein
MICGACLADPPRFRRIDGTNIGDHHHLTPADECYFLFEYTAHKRYNYSATNNLISNLKKKPGSSSIAELRYKALAIRQCAAHITAAVNRDRLPDWTIVPIPPSKDRSDPAHDDRLLRVCRLIGGLRPLDVRELVVQLQSTIAAHEANPGERPTVDDLLDIYRIDEGLTQPAPNAILVVDDVVTAGTHYRATHTILAARFPGVPIHALFIARRVFAPNDLPGRA